MSIEQTPRQFTRDSIGFKSCKNYDTLISKPEIVETEKPEARQLTINEKINLKSYWHRSAFSYANFMVSSVPYKRCWLDWEFEISQPLKPNKSKTIFRVGNTEYKY